MVTPQQIDTIDSSIIGFKGVINHVKSMLHMSLHSLNAASSGDSVPLNDELVVHMNERHL